MRLRGKKAAISAAGSGIGRVGALLFAREGAEVAVIDYNGERAAAVADEIRAAGGIAHSVTANLTRADECKRSVNESADKLGGIDILWSHAGEPGPGGIEDLDLDAFQHSLDLNIGSPVISCGEVARHMRQRGGGAIVLTASVSGLVGSQFSPTYSAAKFGVVGLGKSLALALAEDGIRVNVLCPGPVNTPMLPQFLGRGETDPNKIKQIQDKFTSTIPLGRVAEPEDIAHAALYLASDDAAYVTGVALPVDGGFSSR